ncbi:MAG: hypothetical protein KKH41_08390 [Candidatus Thermoplasmatota archaeon]|nr:hypothetical protein [Euryarchaeota archaeon]MBU4592583.1 hypothetical protein [Candidatus Thermoplasmatota archaeon]
MNDRQIRGSVINGYLKYVEKTWGKDGYEDCCQKTRINDIKIRDGQQYNHDMLLAIIHWISDTHGAARVRQAGKHTVQNLGLLAYIVRFANMDTMLNKAKNLYADAYSFGEVNTTPTERGAEVTMKDVSQIPEDCIGWEGAFEGMLELTHSKGRVLKTKCQLKGDSHCEYDITWK